MKTSKIELWKTLEQKFCVDLKRDFSNKDIAGWLNHFAPNEKINIYQHDTGKTFKIYIGNVLTSIFKACIPAKLMAKLYFQKLAIQNYSHSDIELLGIQQNTENEDISKVQIRFFRYNTSGEMYNSAVGVYELVEINGKWHIREMSLYENNESAQSQVDLSKMWFPEKENSA